MNEKSKEQEIEKLINDLSYDDTLKLMNWMVKENKKETLNQKAKPKKATPSDDAMLRRQIGMK